MVLKIEKCSAPTYLSKTTKYLSGYLSLIAAFVSFLFSSCGSYIPRHDVGIVEDSTQVPIISYELTNIDYDSGWYEEAPRSLSLYTYEEPPDYVADISLEKEKTTEKQVSFRYYDEEGRVPPSNTAWGEAWNHRSLILRMDDILRTNGVETEHVRVRMIAHAIVASGWRQNVWNYNAWGVRVGSWDGPWFIKSTVEMNDAGEYYTVFNAAWRSFSSWEEAVQDYVTRISPDAKRDFYKEAYKWLADPDKWADISFWNTLKEGKYFTDQRFTGRRFYSLCNHVRRELQEAS